ncbi:GNAT family N-acetyltransferase [Paracraurococcus lichenis]|uniref:GNAT family N-acetyltransferase n=1 Tax=Paracraurococcus lichenis TaxID=3064888 RepID=A0ABT9E8K0_9PROT|nr:GNAT family N-acetyltransferase [Paracraurococcus sp. LOR1-02]MDO9712510.1 GNAT family N-acetyltransferase [Paracraurococcus sp. LOR1-02]
MMAILRRRPASAERHRYTLGKAAPLDVEITDMTLAVKQGERLLLEGQLGMTGLDAREVDNCKGGALAEALAAAAAAVFEVDLERAELPLGPGTPAEVFDTALAYGLVASSGAPLIRRRQLLQLPLLWHQDPRAMPHPRLPCQLADGRIYPERPPLAQNTVYDRFDPLLGMRVSFRRVAADRDLPLFYAWMNELRVAYFWELAQSEVELHAYLRRLEEDPHAWPLIGCFDGDPAGYFEIYWAKEDRLGPYYEAHDYDRGWHGLIGARHHLGLAKTAAWLRGLTHFLFLDDPRTEKVVGEPRVDNAKLLRYANALAYDKVKEFDFPHKRAALMHCWRDPFFDRVMR